MDSVTNLALAPSVCLAELKFCVSSDWIENDARFFLEMIRWRSSRSRPKSAPGEFTDETQIQIVVDDCQSIGSQFNRMLTFRYDLFEIQSARLFLLFPANSHLLAGTLSCLPTTSSLL